MGEQEIEKIAEKVKNNYVPPMGKTAEILVEEGEVIEGSYNLPKAFV